MTEPISDVELKNIRQYASETGQLAQCIARIDISESQLREAKGEVEGLRAALGRIAEGDLDWHRMNVPALPTAEDISNETRRLARAALAALRGEGE